MAQDPKFVEAIYQGGVLKPLQALNLPDNIHVWVQVVPVTGKEVVTQEDRFKRRLLQLGLLGEVKVPPARPAGDRTPIQVTGSPLSQMIIEERR